MQAQDVMTTAVVTVAPDATVREAATLMLERRISALPVVDRAGNVVGIVSEGDLLRRVELGTDAARSWWLGLLADSVAQDYLKTHGVMVGDVMSSPAISVRRVTPLNTVARLLEERRIKRVPVLESGRLEGIVSRADLVRALATAPAQRAPEVRTDRALRRRVLAEIGKAGVDIAYVNVTVEGGAVHLWGGVRDAIQQKALHAAVDVAGGAREVLDHTFVMPLRLQGALGSV